MFFSRFTDSQYLNFDVATPRTNTAYSFCIGSDIGYIAGMGRRVRTPTHRSKSQKSTK